MKEHEIVRLLTVHIGMPKTGTTSLERHVYPNATGYLGRSYGEGGRHQPSPAEDLFDIYRTSWSESDVGPALVAWSRPHLEHESLLVANEMLTLWGHAGQESQFHPLSDYSHESGFRRTGAHPVAQFLEHLQVALPADWSLRVLLTLRGQTTMLASQYAQESGGMQAASQADFEAKVQRIVREADAYYDYANLIRSLQSVVSTEHLAVGLIEDGLVGIVRAVREFNPSVPSKFETDVERLPRENVRSTGSGWPLRPRRLGVAMSGPTSRLRRILPADLRKIARRSLTGVDAWRERGFEAGRIEVSDNLRTAIQAAYRESNQALETMLGRPLPAGYVD